jgi:uncharacterized protein YjbJ (UPF0337 family)
MKGHECKMKGTCMQMKGRWKDMNAHWNEHERNMKGTWIQMKGTWKENERKMTGNECNMTGLWMKGRCMQMNAKWKEREVLPKHLKPTKQLLDPFPSLFRKCVWLHVGYRICWFPQNPGRRRELIWCHGILWDDDWIFDQMNTAPWDLLCYTLLSCWR